MCYDFPSVVGFCLSFCILSCHAFSYHVIMCIAFAYVFVSCIRAFSPLSVLQSGAPISSGASFRFLSCAGVKLSRNGPRLVKWPYYTTRRPPVKFRSIWRSFGTPTVNRVTAKSVCVLRKNPSLNSPKTPLSLLHALGCSITIVWAKTAPHLEAPSSLYL